MAVLVLAHAGPFAVEGELCVVPSACQWQLFTSQQLKVRQMLCSLSDVSSSDKSK